MVVNKVDNFEYLRFLNPFDTMFWVDFDLLYPQPGEDEWRETKPDYSIDDFRKTFAVEFQGYIEDGMTLNPLYLAFENIATDMVSYKLVGENDNTWKLLVSMYIAHNLELAMARLKNQADEISLTPEKPKDKKITYKLERPESMIEQLQQTKYGFAFWTIYSPYAKFRYFGIYTNRGLEE